MGEVRKLQKKLRQIENLEIKITLSPEERLKISRKAELRSRLAGLVLQLSGPQQTPGIVEEEANQEKMKRQVEDSSRAIPSQMPPASKIPKGEPSAQVVRPTLAGSQTHAGAEEGGGEIQVGLEGGRSETGRRRDTEGAAKSSTHCPDLSEGSPALPASPAQPRTETQQLEREDTFASLQALWEKARFRLRLLRGHSDIVTCVVAIDNLVVSGSRDTTVKVWHVPTATEQRNLGGHSGGVTCLSAPPPEYCRRLARSQSLSEKERFILSGSVDCCVKIWALSTGHCIKSIYTFNAVTALCFMPEGPGYIITGSDAGKVQAWGWHTLENCQSINAHQEAVTSIQSQGPLVFSGSADGGVSVWECLYSDHDPLRLLHHWTAQVTGCGGGARLALSPRGDRVFVAHGRASVRILHWRTGAVSRLTNHSSVTGVTDCVHQTAGLLIGSCYDLTNGESSLNLFSLPQCRYLASLTSAEAPRILCFAAWLTGSGGHRWVTGGHSLIVWEQLPKSGKQRGDVTAKRDSRLEDLLLESEGDSEDDEQSDDYDEEDDDGANDEEKDYQSHNAAEAQSASWFRCVLQ